MAKTSSPTRQLSSLVKGRPDLATMALAVILQHEQATKPAVLTGADAYAHFAFLHGRSQECLAILGLDRRRRPVGCEVLTMGSDRATVVDARQIIRWALSRNPVPASAIVIAHNHPSGDPSPSKEDHEVTIAVRTACRTVGIEFLDHLVLGSYGKFCSLME